MLEPLHPGHPYSAFEKIVENGDERNVPRPPQGERWEMERALYIFEHALEDETTARRRGVVMIDWWAPRFTLCDAPELRQRFAKVLARSYEWRYLVPLREDFIS